MSGLSSKVIESRHALILSQIESHAPSKERYTLIAKIDNVGVALLVYGLDESVGRKVQDVQTQWTGCGPMYMGNKGAVGVRFRVPDDDGGAGEVFTYVAATHSCILFAQPTQLDSSIHILFTPGIVACPLHLAGTQIRVLAPHGALAQT